LSTLASNICLSLTSIRYVSVMPGIPGSIALENYGRRILSGIFTTVTSGGCLLKQG